MTADLRLRIDLPAVIDRRYRRYCETIIGHSIAPHYRGRTVAAGLKRGEPLVRGDGVARGGRGERFGVGVGVGISAASFGFTGSARRTSGSAADGAGTLGVVGSTVAVGVGSARVSTAGVGEMLSAGCACGAIILSDTVAVAAGKLPGVCLGLSRCIWSSHFITVNPMTRTRMPITSGTHELRPSPPLGAALRLRTLTVRTGSGSGASCK
jgi:hypothetical protein